MSEAEVSEVINENENSTDTRATVPVGEVAAGTSTAPQAAPVAGAEEDCGRLSESD